jgi:hypothetical protein
METAVCSIRHLLPGSLVAFLVFLVAGFSRSGEAARVGIFEIIHFREARTTSHAKMFRRRKTPTTSLVGAMERRVTGRN